MLILFFEEGPLNYNSDMLIEDGLDGLYSWQALSDRTSAKTKRSWLELVHHLLHKGVTRVN